MKTRTYTFNLRIGFTNNYEYIPREVLKDIKSINFNFSGFIGARKVYIKPLKLKIVDTNALVPLEEAKINRGTLIITCKATVPHIPRFLICDQSDISDINIEWNNIDDYKKDYMVFEIISGSSITYKNKDLAYCDLVDSIGDDLLIDTTSHLLHPFTLRFTGDFNRKYYGNINIDCSINNPIRREYTNKDGIVNVCGYKIEFSDTDTGTTYCICDVYLTYADMCELINGNGKISFIYKRLPVTKDMIKYINEVKIYALLNDDSYITMHTFKQNDDFIISLNSNIGESCETQPVDEEYDHHIAYELREKCKELEPMLDVMSDREALQIYNQLYKYIITASISMKFPFTKLNEKMINDYTDKDLLLLDKIFRLFTGSSLYDFLDNLHIE